MHNHLNMRRFKGIKTRRNIGSSPSWKIVFEWEDIITKTLGTKLYFDNPLLTKYIYPIINKLKISNFIHMLYPQKDIYIKFESIAKPKKLIQLNKNCIPAIIDFWLKDSQLQDFFSAYKNVPLLLVTNREVYDKLKQNNCPLNYEHWPLSLPDYYSLNSDIWDMKQFDLCLFGRNSPFFIRLLDEYCKSHPNFSYIHRIGDNSKLIYVTNKGEIICEDKGRDSYINLIRKTRVSCYCTPGIDEAKVGSNSYNQVTPRLFEMLCNCCKVIGHYPNSSDVLWYDLQNIVPNVENYEEFEKCLDEMLCNPFDFVGVQKFMSKHYTSTRASMLRDILSKYNIVIKESEK